MKKQTRISAQALKAALQMEIEGKEFYQKTAEKSDSLLAKKLFERLAEEEDVHIQRINEIFKTIKSWAEWPARETTFKHEKSLKKVFREAIKGMDREAKGSSSELEAIKTAIGMEDKSYTFYRSRDAEATYTGEKLFYQALTAEEREHYLALVDAREYLTNPQGWFTVKEHWSLDGG